jgi:phosphoribosylformylglycinamidine (FGAM) synthase-like enzyme
MASSQTAKKGDLAVLLGSKTGRDGIAGASFASRELDEDSKASKPQIQIGDPFEEKLLIECCMDLLDKDLIASMQDMGAAGILSSSSEIAHKSGCGIDITVEKIPLREKGMAPWEIFLSESQERMLLIVEEDKLDPVFALAAHYGLDCAVVGVMTDSCSYRVYHKHGIWEQYDSMVQLHTIEGPGSPVAVVEVPDTERACLLTMEAEPNKCWTDPYMGASETMALSLRGLWISGAEILGMTNCLNFASPEAPEKFYELEQSIKGLADTCKNLDCPVVSGNVSLYNETASGQIYPTPLVVTAGLLKDRSRRLASGNAAAGDTLFIVGDLCGSMGASRYQVMKNGKPAGKTVAPDNDKEKAFRERAMKTAADGAASSGRGVAGGGLAVALANEAIASGRGINVVINSSLAKEELLFSEGGARAIYAVPKEKVTSFEKIWEGFPCTKIGTVEGDKFEWKDMFSVDLSKLKKAFVEGCF